MNRKEQKGYAEIFYKARGAMGHVNAALEMRPEGVLKTHVELVGKELLAIQQAAVQGAE